MRFFLLMTKMTSETNREQGATSQQGYLVFQCTGPKWGSVSKKPQNNYEIIKMIGCSVNAVAKAKKLEQLSAFQDRMKTMHHLTEGTIFGTYSVIKGSLPRQRI